MSRIQGSDSDESDSGMASDESDSDEFRILLES